MLVIGKIYSFEIIREVSESSRLDTSAKGTEVFRGNCVASYARLGASDKGPDTCTSDDVKLTYVERIEGTLSNILTDPDNTPRYIFTNVLITNSEGQFRGEMHSVPENMVSNVHEL
jgi:hypothetical protein